MNFWPAARWASISKQGVTNGRMAENTQKVEILSRRVKADSDDIEL